MFPHLLSRRGPGRYVAPSGGGGETDPGFEEQPIVTVTSTGDVGISGKVKPGAFGKFVFPLATIAPNRIYTFRYDPDFSRLTQQGKLAMVGFGLKNGNDFHIVGLRGDGSTGLDKYKVSGTPPNGWNKQTGHTETDGGAPANGTQAGPNWIRLITSADGTQIIFQTSADGSSWTEEFAAYTPSPYSTIGSVTTFGIALWFSNTDTGPFSITIDQFASASAGLAITYRGRTGSSTANGVDIGPAHAARYVYAACVNERSSASGPRTITSVTFNGATAKVLKQKYSSAGGNSINIVSAGLLVTAGTTVDVVFTFSTGEASDLFVWTVLDGVPNDAYGIASSGTASADLDVREGGGVIAVAMGNGGSEAGFTWTGIDEEYDASASTTDPVRVSAASRDGLTADTTYTVSADSSMTIDMINATSFAPTAPVKGTITHVSSAAGSNGGTTSAITIPTVQTGDVLLVFSTSNDGGAPSSVTDNDTGGETWTRIPDTVHNGVVYYWKRATGSTSGKTITITYAGGTGVHAGVSAFRGCRTFGLPYEQWIQLVNASGDETHDIGITPVPDNSMIVFIVGNTALSANAQSSQTVTNPGALTEVLQVGGTSIAVGSQATAGDTGAATWTQTNAGTDSLLMSLIPADA